jgi:phytoene desaturase
MTRACVIGAGFGGLAAAIRLQSSGVETTLIEARDRPGGHAWGWERQGFTFDAGPSNLGDPDALRELWQLIGHDMADDAELLPVDPLRRLSWTDGVTLDLPTDAAATRAEVARIAPDDTGGYDDFQRWAAQALRAGSPSNSERSLTSLAKAAPHFVRHQGWRSAYGLVSGFVKSPKLREAFTVQLLLAGANPLSASALQVLGRGLEQQHGSWWPKGGMNHFASTLAAQFQKLGGTMLLHDPVLHIHTLGDRASEVECVSGWRQRFDAVCSSADVVHSYRDLLASSQRGPEMARKLVRQPFGPSLFTVYFGLEGSWPGIPHHSVLFGPRYQRLLKDIFEHGVLPRDQLIFLDHPSVTDPSLAGFSMKSAAA